MKTALIVPAGHVDRVYGIIPSPDQRLWVSWGKDRTIKIWNKEGRLLRDIQFLELAKKAGFDEEDVEAYLRRKKDIKLSFHPDSSKILVSYLGLGFILLHVESNDFFAYRYGKDSAYSEANALFIDGTDEILVVKEKSIGIMGFSKNSWQLKYQIPSRSAIENGDTQEGSVFFITRNLDEVELGIFNTHTRQPQPLLKTGVKSPFPVYDLRVSPNKEKAVITIARRFSDQTGVPHADIQVFVFDLINGKLASLYFEEDQKELTVNSGLYDFFISEDGNMVRLANSGLTFIYNWDITSFSSAPVATKVGLAERLDFFSFSKREDHLHQLRYYSYYSPDFRVLDLSSNHTVVTSQKKVIPVLRSKVCRNGKTLIALVGDVLPKTHRVKVFDLDQKSSLREFDCFSYVDFSIEERMQEYAWDSLEGHELNVEMHCLAHIDISQDGDYVLFRNTATSLRLLNTNNEKQITLEISGEETLNHSVDNIFPSGEYSGPKVINTAISLTNKVVVVRLRSQLAEEFLNTYHLETGALIHSKRLTKSAASFDRSNGLVVSDNGRQLFVENNDGQFVQFDPNTLEKTIEPNREKNAATAAASLSQKISFTDRGLALTDLATGQIVQRFELPEFSLAGTTFTLSRDRSLLIGTSGFKKSIVVWDVRTGNIRYNYDQHICIDWIHPTVTIFDRGGTPTVISAVGDNHIRIWDLKTGDTVGTVNIMGDDDWAVITPSGVFDASPGAMNKMYYTVGLEIIELDQLKNRYWQPGLLPILLKHAKGEVKNVAAFDRVPLYPKVLSMEVRNDTLSVKLAKRNGGIGKTKFFINHKEISLYLEDGSRRADVNEKRSTAFIIDLKAFENFFENGLNYLGIQTWNEENWLPSQVNIIEYHYSGNTGTPSLHGIFVGTSKYQNDQLSLSFPDQDARYLNNAIQTVGSHLFKDETGVNINATLLTTEHPATATFSSKANIKSAFVELSRKARPQDVVVVYFSGHGANYDDNRKPQYYYLTHEVVSGDLSDPEVRERATISSEELTDWINNVPARKQVLIFDTCYSGKFVDSLKVKDAAVDSTRERAMERMKDRTGVFVLMGSAGDKVSYEASDYGQGLLTYSLLMFMRGAKRSKNTNEAESSVDVMELFLYSKKEVERMSKEFSVVQRPTLRAPLNVESFDIGIATLAAQKQIQLALPKPIFMRSNFMNAEHYLDNLNLSETLDQYLNGSIGIGNRPQAIFIDVIQFPGAHHVRGLYTKTEEGYLLKGKVYKDQVSLGDFVVEGREMEDLVPKIGRQVELLAFPTPEYEIPTDDEVGLLEKGRKEELENLVGTLEFGYRENFMGESYQVPLPRLSAKQKEDIATLIKREEEESVKKHNEYPLNYQGYREEEILNYQYYCVVQSRSRKLPFFAACNLHGGQFVQLDRAGSFIRDQRIPDEYQLQDEFYTYKHTDEEKNIHVKYSTIFHRGHMTKREDAQWGEDAETALRGAKLTFFFTNALPQHGHLNSVVWRGLEDYILHVATDGKEATTDEGYKINIFTGPVFQEDDPKISIADGIDVQIPVLFWKVVYYKKKSADTLYRIGFLMGQKGLLEEAFGHYHIVARNTNEREAAKEPFQGYKEKEVFQVQVSFIEELTQMKFHPAKDPLQDAKKGRQITEVVKKPRKKGWDGEFVGPATYALKGIEL